MTQSSSFIKKSIFVALLALLWLTPGRYTHADTLNDQHNFSIAPGFDAEDRTTVSATMRYASEKAYFYVEDAYWQNTNGAQQAQLLSAVQVLAKEFDDRIYPIETSFFGSEPNPGIDNDPKITIMLTPLKSYAGGYFDTANEYAKSISPTSNEREMIVANIVVLSDNRRIDGFVAHEFQHMISFHNKNLNQNLDDDVWINEMRSEYAIQLLGYNDVFDDSNLQRRAMSFINTANDSLTEWKNLAPDYGQIALFGFYLGLHWPAQVIADTAQNSNIGIVSLQDALKKEGFQTSFLDVFSSWMTANFLNDPLESSLFGYAKDGMQSFHASATKVFSGLADAMSLSETIAAKDWEARWYDIVNFASGNNSVLKINFDSSSMTSFSVPYIVYGADGTKQVFRFDPTFIQHVLYIKDIGTKVSRVVIMPIKHDRLTGFGSDEPTVNLTFTMSRIASDSAELSSISQIVNAPVVPVAGEVTAGSIIKLADYGLHEGDFIRTEGDNNIYIVNDYGYKRLVLSPRICLEYGHLGARGCFDAVKMVPASVRDMFQTSSYFTNGETKDGLIYYLEQKGEDDGILHPVLMTIDEFKKQIGDPRAIFTINTQEQKSYPLATGTFQAPSLMHVMQESFAR